LGRNYAVEILQDGAGTLPSGIGTDTPKYAAVLYTIDGWINKEFQLRFTLDNGTFAGTPLLAIANSDTLSPNGAVTATSTYAPFTTWSRLTPYNGSDTVAFNITFDNTVPANTVLNNQSQILLLYELKDASNLETAGGQVSMEASFKFTELDPSGNPVTEVVNPTLSTVIAQSSDSITASLETEDTGTIFISVNDASKLFTDQGDGTALGAYRDIYTAWIGYLTIGEADNYQPDGVSKFYVGGDPNIAAGVTDLGLAGESSELVIADGQFAASVENTGVSLVSFDDNGDPTTIATATEVTSGQATFKLTNTNLQDLRAAGTVAIQMVVDRNTEVNRVEDPPIATLTINFEDDKIVIGDELKSTLAEGTEMRQIGPDSAECWAFNVPYSTIQDRFNIRITNESSIPGSFTLTLYGPDGNEAAPSTELVNVQDDNGNYIFLNDRGESQLTGPDLNQLEAGQTIHLDAEKLEKVLNTSWSGRAVLRVTSTLPEIEMLALLRNQLMDDASQPLNNLSLGAHGKSCTQGGQ
jgi:hypothetical protein